ncbi:MAG: EVE domain-containing protein [Prevotella sp.]|nr:EVE domain-containing protein [Prevotella sp.]
MKYSLKELINQIETPDFSQYKRYTPLYIKEAARGLNWDEWDVEVFNDYFEIAHNSVAYLGQGVLRPHHKEKIKKSWMRLAPHLKAIASSQDVPLWGEYEIIRKIIRECTEDNMQIATNRLLACLQPKLLCTEVDLKKVNELIDYIITYTDTIIPEYDRNNWEKASFFLLKVFHELFPERHYLDFSYIPWKLLKLFRDKEKTELKTYWLISSNDDVFRLEDCLAENKSVDWQGSFSPKKGDIVFIYRTKPSQRICYMMEVETINIPYRNTINDSKYWGDNHSPEGTTNPDELYHRLKFLKKPISESLHLKELQKQGMKGVPQGPRRLFGNLLEYILNAFEPYQDYFDEIPNPETVFEGAKKEIVVNRYERSPEARNMCIAAHGCKCAVCGLDFEKMYGEIGKGFIHVHHIVPISSIGAEYQIDPVKDLIPVCPNCHAMLHRQEPPYSVDDLKKMLGKPITVEQKMKHNHGIID